MLALAAAQLQSKAEKHDGGAERKRIWVDVGTQDNVIARNASNIN